MPGEVGASLGLTSRDAHNGCGIRTTRYWSSSRQDCNMLMAQVIRRETSP